MNWGIMWSAIGVIAVLIVQVIMASWCVATLSAKLEAIEKSVTDLKTDQKDQGARLWESVNSLWGKFNDCRAEHCAPAKVKHG